MTTTIDLDDATRLAINATKPDGIVWLYESFGETNFAPRLATALLQTVAERDAALAEVAALRRRLNRTAMAISAMPDNAHRAALLAYTVGDKP